MRAAGSAAAQEMPAVTESLDTASEEASRDAQKPVPLRRGLTVPAIHIGDVLAEAGAPRDALKPDAPKPATNRLSKLFHRPHAPRSLLENEPESHTGKVDVTAQYRVDLGGDFIGEQVRVSCKLDGQFSLEWSEVPGRFPAGRINLYFLLDNHEMPELEWIIRGLTEQHPQVVAQAEDSVGAKLVHGLLLANNERTVQLAVELFEIHPPLLLGTHGQHSDNKPVFSGEASLHIVAVNKRVAAAEAMVRTAVRCLTPAQVLEMLTQSVTGLFFKEAPMCYFGGSVIAYLSVFGILVPVLQLLESLPAERAAAMHVRGKLYYKYSPLHATVMAGRVPEFDALVKYGADEFAKDADGFTPMLLAVKMGMRDIFLHSLRHHIKTEWIWGPIAAYKLPLIGLDTEGISGKISVMELTADNMAREKTKTMLLDSFMNGAGASFPKHSVPHLGRDFLRFPCQVSSSTSSSKNGNGEPQRKRSPPIFYVIRSHGPPCPIA